MNYQLVKISSNSKTGPIPVSTSSSLTCPDVCPLKKKGCYASAGYYTKINWQKVDQGKRGSSFNDFLLEVKKLPKRQLWRHNQAGDLPGANNRINREQLSELVKANRGKRGWTYTHKPLTRSNLSAIKEANKNGFTINLSANSFHHADELTRHNLPIATIAPSNYKGLSSLVKSKKLVMQCPATKNDRVTCSDCGLCQVQDRKYVIAFPAHGSQKKYVSKIAS